jgi:AcrR family transcriptional regulator
MGVAERKERHKEELKKEILEAAKMLFMERGYEATSIRNIAEKIEYSPATIYLHYKDRDEIMHALHQEGFKMLVSYLSVIGTIVDPFERLKAMGRAYIKFAMENPDMYDLIFVLKDPIKHVESCYDENWDEGDRAFDVLHKTVVECQGEGHFKNLEAYGFSFVIWSTMHGMCTLRISGHLDHVAEAKKVTEDIDSLVTHTYDTFVSVLERLKK